MPGKKSEYEMAIKIAGEIEKSFYESTKLTKKELNDIARQAVRTSSAAEAASGSGLRNLKRGLEDAAPAFQGLERVSDAAFAAIRTAAVTTGAAVAAIATASMTVGSGFEEQMSTVQAISMASDEELNKLNKKARELGKSTKFSASEVGQGFEYMAMAGWKTEDMLAGISGVLDLAAASGEDLGSVSDIVTDAMTAFGLGADQVERFADVLATASSNSNTNVAMMGETFKYVAPVAGALGYEIEDMATAIGLMANSGIKASQAGTSLRSMLSRMTGPTKEVQVAMDTLGVSLTDSEGNMKSFLQVQKDLREGFKGMSEAQAAEVASHLAGQEAMSGLLAIVNASDEDFEKLSVAIADSTGAAEKMADIRLDNLKGDLTILQSAAEGFGIELYEGLQGPARELVQFGTGFIGDMTEEITAKLPTARREIKEFAQGIQNFAEPLIGVGEWLIDHPGAIAGPIAGIGTAVTTYRAANGIMSLASALGHLNPVGMGIMALGGVAGVITGIGISVKKSAEEAKKANLAAHFGDIALSMKDLDEISSAIIQSESLDNIRESMAAFAELEGIGDQIDDAVRELNKTDWKLSLGMELTEQENENYKAQIQAFIDSTQAYVSQQHYAVTLSVETLMGEDANGSDLVEKMNAFYSGKSEELAALGTQLNEAMTEAFNDGLLDPEEAEIIANLKKEMAEIQAELAGNDFEAGLDLLGMKYGGQLDADSFKNLQEELRTKVDEASEAYDTAYRDAMSALRSQAKAEDWSDEEFEENTADLNAGYIRQKAELQAEALRFQTEVIQDAYPELAAAIEKLNGLVSSQTMETFQEATESGLYGKDIPFIAEDISDMIEGTLDSSTKDALSSLAEYLIPSAQQMQETRKTAAEMGIELPEGVDEGVRDANALGALSGSTDALWGLIGQETESPEYQEMLQTMVDSGAAIPEEFNNGIMKNLGIVEGTVTEMYQSAENAIRKFSSGNTAKTSTGNRNQRARGLLEGHAEGGIFTQPHIAWFAENGPESAIPLDGSRNAIDLWLRTGELLGMDGLTGGSDPVAAGIENAVTSGGTDQESSVVYSPTYYFYGDSIPREEAEELMETEQEKFDRMFAMHNKNRLRSSFS